MSPFKSPLTGLRFRQRGSLCPIAPGAHVTFASPLLPAFTRNISLRGNSSGSATPSVFAIRLRSRACARTRPKITRHTYDGLRSMARARSAWVRFLLTNAIFNFSNFTVAPD